MSIYELKIKDIRIQKNITQTQLAKRVGFSRNYLSELEHGKYDIKLSLLIEIAEVLEVNLEDLYSYKNRVEK